MLFYGVLDLGDGECSQKGRMVGSFTQAKTTLDGGALAAFQLLHVSLRERDALHSVCQSWKAD